MLSQIRVPRQAWADFDKSKAGAIRKGNVHKSSGRGQPFTPQSTVVITVRMASDKPNRIDNNALTICPYSADDAVYAPARGEIMFGRVDDTYSRGQRFTTTNLSNLHGFTSMNGIHHDDKIILIGLVENPSAGRLNNDIEDDAGVVKIAGVGTCINTGPDTIPAMASVFVSKVPYTTIDSEGRTIPAIDCTGMGVPRDKFYASTHVMCAATSSTQAAYLKAAYEDKLDNQYESPKSFASMINSICALGGVQEHMPLHPYTHMLAALDYFDKAMLTEAGSKQTKMIDIAITNAVKTYNTTIEFNRKKKDRYAHSIKQHLLSKSAELNIEQCKSNLNAFAHITCPLIRSECFILYAEHEDYVAAHYFGKCLNTSPPGQQLPILIRAGIA